MTLPLTPDSEWTSTPEPMSSDPLGMAPTWCRRCEIHRATAASPLCPVCLDDRAKETKP